MMGRWGDKEYLSSGDILSARFPNPKNLVGKVTLAAYNKGKVP